MPNYHFRIRFRLSPSSRLGHDESVFDLRRPSGQGDHTLDALGAESISDSQWLALRNSGGGFPTEEKAMDAGRIAKSAILWCGVRMRLGMDLGDDKAHGGASEYLKKIRREQGIRLLNEVHGLNVYGEDPELPTRFASFSASGRVDKDISRFEKYFNEAVDMNLQLTDKESLAFELYGLSQFESSSRARFITLVIAIESIIEDKKRNAEAVKHVEQLVKFTNNSGLPLSEVDSLRGSLRRLKYESISKAGRDLIDRYLGQAQYDGKVAEIFFRDCYNIRSQLVHNGKPADETIDLRSLVARLDRLVADLLVSYVEAMQ